MLYPTHTHDDVNHFLSSDLPVVDASAKASRLVFIWSSGDSHFIAALTAYKLLEKSH